MTPHRRRGRAARDLARFLNTTDGRALARGTGQELGRRHALLGEASRGPGPCLG